MPNGTYGGVRGRSYSALLDYLFDSFVLFGKFTVLCEFFSAIVTL